LRVLRQKRRQARDDFARPERARHHHAQHTVQTVHAARRMRGLVELAENLSRALQEYRTGVGRRDPPRRAQKKFGSHPRLQARHRA
jgi:hypothetical protein